MGVSAVQALKSKVSATLVTAGVNVVPAFEVGTFQGFIEPYTPAAALVKLPTPGNGYRIHAPSDLVDVQGGNPQVSSIGQASGYIDTVISTAVHDLHANVGWPRNTLLRRRVRRGVNFDERGGQDEMRDWGRYVEFVRAGAISAGLGKSGDLDFGIKALQAAAKVAVDDLRLRGVMTLLTEELVVEMMDRRVQQLNANRPYPTGGDYYDMIGQSLGLVTTGGTVPIVGFGDGPEGDSAFSTDKERVEIGAIIRHAEIASNWTKTEVSEASDLNVALHRAAGHAFAGCELEILGNAYLMSAALYIPELAMTFFGEKIKPVRSPEGDRVATDYLFRSLWAFANMIEVDYEGIGLAIYHIRKIGLIDDQSTQHNLADLERLLAGGRAV